MRLKAVAACASVKDVPGPARRVRDQFGHICARGAAMSLSRLLGFFLPSAKRQERSEVRSPDEAERLFALRHHSFKLFLTAWNTFQETMADVEYTLCCDHPFGLYRVRALCTKVATQVFQCIQQLERLDRLEIEEEDLATLNIKFPPAPRSGQIVAEISEAGMSFGEKHVFSGANFVIEKGDRIALVGRNGEGKTTLARMLIGQLTPTEGSVRLGANVNIGYYAQNQDDLMDGEFTVYDTLDRVAVGDIRTRLRDILGAFLFRGEDIDKKVKVLSGGERARLAMARMMLEPRNLLVLVEPTNHMDMRSKDILKNAIMKYDGTVVVVSHDREFLDGMVEKVYEFRDGGVKEYLGGIYYFLEKRKLESLQEVERRDAPAKTPAKGDEPKPAVSGKLSYEQRKEQEKQLRKAKKVVETIEAELADIEKRIAEYDARFAAATEYNEADYKAYNELKTRYDHQMHEWEKASYELEIIENE